MAWRNMTFLFNCHLPTHPTKIAMIAVSRVLQDDLVESDLLQDKFSLGNFLRAARLSHLSPNFNLVSFLGQAPTFWGWNKNDPTGTKLEPVWMPSEHEHWFKMLMSWWCVLEKSTVNGMLVSCNISFAKAWSCLRISAQCGFQCKQMTDCLCLGQPLMRGMPQLWENLSLRFTLLQSATCSKKSTKLPILFVKNRNKWFRLWHMSSRANCQKSRKTEKTGSPSLIALVKATQIHRWENSLCQITRNFQINCHGICADRTNMKIASSFWLQHDYCFLWLCYLWRVYIYCLVWKATPTRDGWFSTWSDVQKATWSCFDQNPSYRRSINSVMSVLFCHISLLFVFGEKNFFKLLPQNTEQDSLHTIGQNLGFQTSEHEPLDTWFCNDITENLDICQLFWVGLLVNLHHTDWVGASVRYGRGAESQDGTTSQLLELCILLRDLFTQEIVSGEPTVKNRTKWK